MWQLRLYSWVVMSCSVINQYSAQELIWAINYSTLLTTDGSLHCLPVMARIDYKIALVVYKCLNNLSPSYMSEFISKYIPSRTLRSNNSNLIVTKTAKYKTLLGERAFSVNASHVWNSLPLELKNCTSINIFKQHLKTYLFRKHFSEYF